MSALGISLGGLQGASVRFEKAAQRVVANGAAQSESLGAAAGRGSANAPLQGGAPVPAGAQGLLAGDTTAALVELKQSELDFKVNARVAGRVSDLYKETLDLLGGRRDR
ncbi:hypothetical protein H2509_04670 [Stappia sp. F7233]|uniref:Uncharacterized protein n=1 Tax=Stappia albiluteola TaxID=2758565 RepID=A0A839ABK2_9HYPH|nr:hypothetical protein [Stappia albiluteola]MBA5776418.1 hypothetical protein [Stappia albiluteola]